jgi:ABC-type multidrug transport system permease subunit
VLKEGNGRFENGAVLEFLNQLVVRLYTFLLISGILAILIGIIMIVWAIAFVQVKTGGLIMVLILILLLSVGGGFVSAFVGVVAGVACTKIHTPLTK